MKKSNLKNPTIMKKKAIKLAIIKNPINQIYTNKKQKAIKIVNTNNHQRTYMINLSKITI